ncbi:adenylate kinase [Candidatus Dojkabacteria bacterium]|nr:adenylate kinase [Candidatus Dojkabacteria bacterium]
MKKTDKPFEIIVLGPPVSGKGTQSELLAKTFDIPHISTGAIFHKIKNDKKNPLAKQVKKYMNSGGLVPDELVNKLVEERINKEDCKLGFVLDGYPRTQPQAEAIKGMVELDYVFLINVSDEVIIERISGRRVCIDGHTWHLRYSPPKEKGICDICKGRLFQREDDKPEIVKQRLKIYHIEMDKVISLFKEGDLLIEIDGEANIDQVFQQIVRYLVYDMRNQLYG